MKAEKTERIFFRVTQEQKMYGELKAREFRLRNANSYARKVYLDSFTEPGEDIVKIGLQEMHRSGRKIHQELHIFMELFSYWLGNYFAHVPEIKPEDQRRFIEIGTSRKNRFLEIFRNYMAKENPNIFYSLFADFVEEKIEDEKA